MEFINKLKSRWNFEQRLIILNILTLLLPYYIASFIYIIEIIYLFCSKKAINLFKKSPNSKYIAYFLLISCGVSVFHHNWIGVMVCIIIALFVVLIFHFKDNITPELFSFIIDLIILMSVFWAFYGFLEYLEILQRNGHDEFIIKIYSRRENRLNSVMLNANYYVTVIEMVVLAIFYKMSKHYRNYKQMIWYTVVLAINLFIMYLTGSRASWVSLGIATFVYFLLIKNKPICYLYITGILIVLIYFLFNIDQIPRIEYLVKNLGVRYDIWTGALKSISDYPFFGVGPMGYFHTAPIYGNYLTHHAHNIYLEVLASYGIIGCSIGLIYCIKGIKRVEDMFYIHRHYAAFVTSVIVTILIHGMIDFSVFFLHPGLLFLFIVTSNSMYNNKTQNNTN